jgi:hypothetical protein
MCRGDSFNAWGWLCFKAGVTKDELRNLLITKDIDPWDYWSVTPGQALDLTIQCDNILDNDERLEAFKVWLDKRGIEYNKTEVDEEGLL